MVKATAEGSFDAILSIDVSFLSAVADMIDQAAGHRERIATAKELTDRLINMTVAVSRRDAVLNIKIAEQRHACLVRSPRDAPAVVLAVRNHVLQSPSSADYFSTLLKPRRPR